MNTTTSSGLDRLLADNRAAADDFIRAAAGVPRREWTTPLAEDKWSPAQHVHHIVLAYEAAVRDVRDHQRASLIGTRRQRWFWKLAGLTQVMWLHTLPRGVRAPRELRPPDTSPVPAALLAQLRHAVDEFDCAMRTAWTKEPAHRVQHPYFGDITLRQMLVLSAVHTRHHTAAIGAKPT